MSHLDWKPLVATTDSGSEVILRRLRMEDIDHCGRWINDPDLRQMLSVDYPMGEEDERKWLATVTAPLLPNPSDLGLAIWLDNEIVGNCGLHSISMRHRHAEIGILIGESSARGKGVGVAVYSLLHHFAFAEMNLQALRADVYSHNKASRKLHLKMDYLEVGRIPQWYFKADEHRDLLIYYLSQHTWRQHI